jgi:phosphohistidine phosphatase
MELILIRHGQAEAREEKLDDTKRSLTDKGRKKLKKALPGLKAFLKGREEIQIWSSPLLRASETAEILSDGLKVKDISYFDFIADGDFQKFSEQIARTKRKACVLVIGHEPYLGEWSQKTCGYNLPFQKGSAASFKVDSVNPISSELQWFIQSDSFEQISKK